MSSSCRFCIEMLPAVMFVSVVVHKGGLTPACVSKDLAHGLISVYYSVPDWALQGAPVELGREYIFF